MGRPPCRSPPARVKDGVAIGAGFAGRADELKVVGFFRAIGYAEEKTFGDRQPVVVVFSVDTERFHFRASLTA